MRHGQPVTVLVRPDLVLAPAGVGELGAVLASAAGEIVADAREVLAAVDRLAVASAGGPDLGGGLDGGGGGCCDGDGGEGEGRDEGLEGESLRGGDVSVEDWCV